MDDRSFQRLTYSPEIGCLLMLGVVSLMCLLPFLFVDAMQSALLKLHLAPQTTFLVVMAIFVGGLVNLPVHRFERQVEQVVYRSRMSGLMGWVPVVHRSPRQTILAVNVGGCLIPVLLCVYELWIVFSTPGLRATTALAAAVVVNVAVCYWIARPIEGVGIAMPPFTSPIVSVGLAWLLLMPAEYDEVRAPVAFIAGVAGPLIGADMLHLRDFAKVSVGLISIGGAGTFDGIVLSGFLAALLA